jgi:hypothetical protein
MTTRHLTLAELQKRNRDLIAEERQQTKGATSFWYLSYASPTAFLGGVIVRAFGFVHACQRARDLNINPGGEIRGVPIPTSKNPAAEYIDKLLSKAELEKCWGEMVKLSKLEN